MSERDELFLSMKGQADEAIAALRKVQQGLTGLEKGVAQAEKKWNSSMTSMREVADGLVGASRRIEYAFRRMGGQILAIFGVGGIGYTIQRAISEVNQFQTALAEVNTLLTGDTTAAMKGYKKGIEELSKASGKSVVELTKGAYQIISAGTKGSESVKGTMELLEVANKAAIAGMTDTFSSVDVLTTALNSYNKGTEEAQKFSDVLFTTVKLGKVEFTDLAVGLGQVVAMAANAGVSFDEVGASMAALTKGGIVPRQAFTSLQAIIRSLINPSKQLTALFKSLGFASIEAALRQKGLLGVMEIIKKATGGNTFELRKLITETEAIRGASVLAGNGLKSFQEAMDEMKKSTGATEEAYGKMTETFEFKSNQFQRKLEALYRAIGDKLMPVVSDLMDKAGAWVEANADAIVKFFQDAVDAVVAFGKFVIEWGPTIAITLGSIWATGKLIEWVGLVGSALGMIKTLASVLGGIPALLGKIGAMAAKIGPMLGQIALPLTMIYGSMKGLAAIHEVNKEAFAEGEQRALTARETYSNIRRTAWENLQGLNRKQMESIVPGSEAYEGLLRIGMRQFTSERGGEKPSLIQSQKIRKAIEEGIQAAIEGRTLSGLASAMSDAMVGEVGSDRVIQAAKAALSAGTEEGTKEGAIKALEDPKLAKERERKAREWAKKMAALERDAQKFLEALRKEEKLRGMDEVEKIELRYYEMVNSIIERRWKKEEDRSEALQLAELKFQAELDGYYKRRFEEGQKRDAEIAAKRQRYEKDIEIESKKALDSYFKDRDEWESKMRQKYPAAYAEFEVAQGRATEVGMPGALAGSNVMFGEGEVGSVLKDFLAQATDWLKGTLKDLGDAVADVGMDFANIFLDIFKTPMNQLKQLLSHAIELAAEGKQFLVVTNRERAEIEAQIGRPLTDAELREIAEIISPKELEDLERRGRIGEYTVVGEQSPEQAANSMLEKFISFWENLANNLDGILNWINSTAFPRLINAIIKAIPKIVSAIITFIKASAENLAKDWLQKILDVIFEWIPKLVKGVSDSIKGFMRELDVEKLINSIINFIIDLVITIVKDIIDLIANVIPDLIRNINRAIPGIVKNLVTAIVTELIPEIVTALWEEISEFFQTDITGSKAWDGVLNLLTGGLFGTVGKKFHEGGMVVNDLGRTVDKFSKAVRAHSGMLVGGLHADEVPIIAQVGEAVLSRGAVGAIGGPAVVNELNRAAAGLGSGQGVGGRVVNITNNLSVQHLLSADTERVIDDMQASLLRRGVGKVNSQIRGSRIVGFNKRMG